MPVPGRALQSPAEVQSAGPAGMVLFAASRMLAAGEHTPMCSLMDSNLDVLTGCAHKWVCSMWSSDLRSAHQ